MKVFLQAQKSSLKYAVVYTLIYAVKIKGFTAFCCKAFLLSDVDNSVEKVDNCHLFLQFSTKIVKLSTLHDMLLTFLYKNMQYIPYNIVNTFCRTGRFFLQNTSY